MSSFVLLNDKLSGAVLNAGTLTMDSSKVIAPKSYAVYATSGATSEQVSSSTIIKNSVLKGDQALYSRRDSTAPTNSTTTQIVEIIVGEMRGGLNGTTSRGANTSITGDIKASDTYFKDVLKYAKIRHLLLKYRK